MKKIITLLMVSFFILAIPCEAKKPKGEVALEISPSNVMPYIYTDSIISVQVYPTYDGSFFRINISNQTNGRIYVEWDNARIDNNKVLFSDDRPITMNLKKEDEVIMAGGSIYNKEITHKGKYYDSMGLLPLFKEKEMKKNNRAYNYNLILPIRLADGSIKDYAFKIKVFWKVTEQ